MNAAIFVFLTTGDLICLAAYFSAFSRSLKTLPETSSTL